MKVHAEEGECDYYAFINSYWEPLSLQLPDPPHHKEGQWHRVIDTALPSGEDIVPLGCQAPAIAGRHYQIAPRSIIVLRALVPHPHHH